MFRAHNPYVTPRRFRHNPYDANAAIAYEDDPLNVTNNSRSESPAGNVQIMDFETTLHKDLISVVNFEPFPAFAANHANPMLPFTKKDCSRLFIGQIPYGSPAPQVEWMVFAATGRRVYFTETIQRWTGSRSPKGCAHTYCLPADRDAIIAMLHRRVLVDDTGVWIAADESQCRGLEDYCGRMKADKTLRFRDRPYQPMVVEEATSDFVPRRPSPAPEDTQAAAAAFPPQYDQFLHAQAFIPAALSELPPQYEDVVPPPPQYDVTFNTVYDSY